jgi:hypothetical protein
VSLSERIRAANERIRVVEAALPARGLVSTAPWRIIGAAGEPGWLMTGDAPSGNFSGSFAGYQPPPAAFFRDAIGFVHLRGVVAIQRTESFVTRDLFFLPPGYRPSALWRRGAASNKPDTGQHDQIKITTGGLVAVDLTTTSSSGRATWVSLDGVSFPTLF